MKILKPGKPVDAVEVVRCRDCKHYARWADGSAMNHCDKHDRTAYDDDFCSYGAREITEGGKKMEDKKELLKKELVRHGTWEPCFEDWRKQIEGDKCSACGFEHYG